MGQTARDCRGKSKEKATGTNEGNVCTKGKGKAGKAGNGNTDDGKFGGYWGRA